MPFNPEKRAEYDKARYKKLKAEYIANNPNYIPRREQQRQKREITIARYGKDDDDNADIDNPFTTLLKNVEKNRPKPKPVYNPNGLEAKKRDDAYGTEYEQEQPKNIFVGGTTQPVKRNNITFY